MSQPIYRQIACHTTDIGSGVLTIKHCVAGPPYPLADILKNVLCLRTVVEDTYRQAIYRIPNISYKPIVLFRFQSFGSFVCLYNG